MPWIVLTALILIGMLSTVVDHASLSKVESRRANGAGQRVVVDPLTGNVSLGDSAADQSFDVGSAADKSPEMPPEDAHVPAEETPAAKTPMASAPAPQAEPNAALKGLPMLRTQPEQATMPAAPAGAKGLVPAPAPEITETVDGQPLPRHSTGNATPASIYSQPFTRDGKAPLISFVVLNAGLSVQADSLIAALPREVSVAFSPYGQQTAKDIPTLRHAGFETWGMLPAMGEHFPQDDPGPLGLVASLPKDELMRRLRAVMSSTIGAVGLVLPPDENFSGKPAIFAPILAEINTRGLELLSTHPTHGVADISKDEKLQAIVQRADMILDPQPDAAQIQAKLAGIPAELAKKNHLIVVLSSRPQTLALLAKWLKENPPSDAMALAPLSAQWVPVEAPAPEAKKDDGAKPDEKKDDKATDKPAEKKDEKPAADKKE